MNSFRCFGLLVLSFVLIVLSFSACKKDEILMITPIPSEPPMPSPLILGHKATGSGINELGLVENSFEAIWYGYAHLDGIEIDVCMSKDSTLWVTHDNIIITCNNDTMPVFSLTDVGLEEISECTDGTLIPLETVFKYLSLVRTSNENQEDKRKFVSLDLKAVSDPYCVLDNKNQIIANKIANLYKQNKPNATIGIESWDYGFLTLIENLNNELETFYLAWNELDSTVIEQAHQDKIDGFSCRQETVSKDIVKLARDKNLRVQMWTVNTEQDIKKALEINPFAIQTDNISFFIDR